ncbi:hypothetical protein HNW13_018040 [Shewanella sp. BF02_Schw]|uniref:beta strand repeat-containing protein n=1 Tax=Shewanella sp. BF02_Schw TaxID=394908 RepID=UPI00177D3F9B|nr:hypothetical protein [Shewanella sp. BF02_Schw]MBO1897641.1 hypothetical protein [Shewanella sp. BF02_Schw]
MKIAGKLKVGLCLMILISGSANAQDPQEIANIDAEMAASSMKQYKEAAIAIYQSTGLWPTSMAALNGQMPAQPKLNGKYVTPSITVNSNGSININIKAATQDQAKRLAGVKGEVFTQSGTSVSMLVTPPAGSNLRSVYKEQINGSNTSNFSVLDDVSLNGKQIVNAQSITANTMELSCLELGSSKVCESATGELTVTTDLARLSQNGQVDESVTADVVAVINKLKSNDMKLTDLIAANSVASELIVTAANIDQGQIETLDAIVATMKSVAISELKVTGSTTLADIIASNGTLTSITGSDINVSGKAIMNTLQANGLLAGNAFVDVANVQALVTNIATIVNLKSNLLQTNRIIAKQGLLQDIQSITANFDNAVIEGGSSLTLNSNSFKGKIVELGAAVVKATLTVNELNVKQINSDTGNLKNLISDSLTSETVNATNTTVANATNTGSLDVSNDAIFNANVIVGGNVNTKDLSVTSAFNVSNLLTTMRLLVNNDAIITGLLTTSGLVVSQNANISKIMTVTNLAASTNMNVSSNTAAKTVSVSSDGNVTGGVSLGALTAKSASVQGITKTTEVQSGSLLTDTLNTTNWVSDSLTSKSIISQYNSSLTKAVVQNLNAQNSQLGAASASSLSLINGITAKDGKFETLLVTAKGLLGSFEAGSAIFNNDLSITGKVTSLNLNANTINASKSNIASLNAASVTVAGLVTGSTVRTSSGNSLASVNNIYVNHEGRIISIEQFKSDCISNWVYACSGTIPRITSPNCVGCTQNSYSTGVFSATAAATILDCPSGCTYAWTVGAGLSKSTCANGSVPAGQSKTVNCIVTSSPSVAINKTLITNVKLEVKHSIKGSINTGNNYPINWTFTGETPLISSVSCPNCTDVQIDLGTFNATYSANISNCSAGCSYQWVFGNGVSAVTCPTGTVTAGASKSVVCKIGSNPSIASGTKLNSTLQLNVINSQLSSLNSNKPTAVQWENQKAEYTPTIIATSCKFYNNNGSCDLPGAGSGGYLDVLLTHTIENCLPSCIVTTTLGAGLTPVSCYPAIASGVLTTATCRVTNTNPLALGQVLYTNIPAIRAENSSKYHQIAGPSLSLQNGNASVAAPSVSLSCSGCVDSAAAKSNFTATANATVNSCTGGCTYSWSLGSSLTKNICSNGSVNSNGSASPSCSFKNTTALASGAKIASSVSLIATNIADTSKKTTRSFNVSWENAAPNFMSSQNVNSVGGSSSGERVEASFTINGNGTYSAFAGRTAGGNWVTGVNATDYEYSVSSPYSVTESGGNKGGSASFTTSGAFNVWTSNSITMTSVAKAGSRYGSTSRSGGNVDISFRKKGTTNVISTITISVRALSENT